MNTSRLPLILLLALAMLLTACSVYESAQNTKSEPASQEEFVPEVVGAPSAVLAQAEFDHGDVPINQPVETTFTIKNVGDQKLIFAGTPQISVVEGCCPPAVHLSNTILEPGEEATVHIEYSMHAGMAGPHLFEIRARTNDPVNPILIMTDKSNWIE